MFLTFHAKADAGRHYKQWQARPAPPSRPGARALAVCCGRTGGDRLCRDTWLLELPACL